MLSNKIPQIFNRSLVQFRRKQYSIDHGSAYIKLLDEVSKNLAERISFVKRQFNRAIQIGSDTGILGRAIQSNGCEALIVDTCLQPLSSLNSAHIVCDEEQLAFQENSFDLIISMMTAHWVNDLPGFFKQCLWSLKPDGWFVAAMIGENSLSNIKKNIMNSDLEHHRKAFQRFSPIIRTQDAGKLLQRADFALPVVDVERFQIQYSSVDTLFNDIRSSGQANACHNRSNTFPILKTQMEFLRNNSTSKEIVLDLDIVFLSGWKPCPNNQQKPLKPGDSEISLAQIL